MINKEKMKRGPKKRPLEERFWAKVDKGKEDECWPWLGGTRNGTDYGMISDELGNRVNAHRISFTLRYGDPGEDWVLHTCDMKHCVNPKHLYIGDRYDWAQKWHGLDLSEADIAERQQKLRRRAKQHYANNREKKIAQVSKYQFDRKSRAIALLGGKCQKCPETHPAALQFHHRDPETKVFMISSKTLAMPKKYPWDVIEAEVQKCDLLCGNCHAKLHSRWDQWIK